MSSEHVRIRREGGLLDIVLNRVERGNALTAEMGEEIVAALATIDESIKVVRLAAHGADFCVGRDSPIPTLGSKPSVETLRQVVAMPPLELYDAIKNASVPVVAVVRGRAVGAGCALASVCDMTLCAEDAIFSIPEMERDIPPLLVMTALMDRLPIKTLAHMVYSREELDAQEALQAGLVRKVYPSADLDLHADTLITTLLTNSVVSLRAIKQYLRLAPEMSGQAATSYAANLAAAALSARF